MRFSFLFFCLGAFGMFGMPATDLSAVPAAPKPSEFILIQMGGSDPIDLQIAALQNRIRQNSNHSAALVEQLGWMFISKARLSHDPGFYKLAEQCALCLEMQTPHEPAALLLRGHVQHAMHRFHDAEVTARELIAAEPERWQSHALLGDALMEQGRLNEAIETYQKMIDLKPCAQTYTRVAHVRWLKGDLDGAIEMMRMSVEAGSTRDPEPAAWGYSRLAFYQWQAGDEKAATWSVQRALEFVKDYPMALLTRGRILLAQGKMDSAVTALETAEAANPLPEYEWALADALRAANQTDKAEKVEARLFEKGATDDPRTFALFLATRKKEPELALKLAQEELKNRRDVFTWDALAWVSLAAGKIEDARTNIRSAQAEGTQDARLFYHAGVIAEASGDLAQASQWFAKATVVKQTLFPSERDGLSAALTALHAGKEFTLE